MLDSKTIDELARRLTASMPAGVREFQAEVEKNVRSSLQAGFSRLDLVTREEFDAQAKVLARTRAQLDELAERVAALESTGENKSGSGGTARKTAAKRGGGAKGQAAKE